MYKKCRWQSATHQSVKFDCFRSNQCLSLSNETCIYGEVNTLKDKSGDSCGAKT